MTTRAYMPDCLRLFALFDLVIVNVQFIAFSTLHGFAEPVRKTFADSVALWLVNGLALLKTYGLFSFMFGVGLGFLMRSAERRALPFGKIYRTRMIGWLVLGVLHGCLFFAGDILVIYAVTGSVLYLFRNWPVHRLVGVGVALLILQPVVALPLLLGPPETAAVIVKLEQTILTQGSFLDAIIFRSFGFAFTVPLFLILQGISAIGWFCLELASVRSGMIDNAHHPLWRRAKRTCLLPDVAISLLGAGLWQLGPATLSLCLTVIVAPIATLGHLGLIAALSRPQGPIMALALAAGGLALGRLNGCCKRSHTPACANTVGSIASEILATATAVSWDIAMNPAKICTNPQITQRPAVTLRSEVSVDVNDCAAKQAEQPQSRAKLIRCLKAPSTVRSYCAVGG